MRTARYRWALWIAWLGLATMATTAVAQSVPSGGSPRASASAADQLPLYATRQTVFGIPFAIDRRITQPIEVQLYVSVDRGATWQLHARQPPNTSQFTFRARGDGEYWFASRTLDARQPSRSSEQLEPELRVVVDTVPPQLDFGARPGQGGEVITTWQVVDPNLAPSSLKIEYQENVGQPWKPVAIEQSAEDVPRNTSQGQMTWWPETRSPTINIRAEIRDRAGNLAVVNRRLLLPATNGSGLADGGGRPSRPDDPFARRGRPSEGAVAWPSDNRPVPGPPPGSYVADTGPSRPTTPQQDVTPPPNRTMPLDLAAQQTGGPPTGREGPTAEPAPNGAAGTASQLASSRSPGGVTAQPGAYANLLPNATVPNATVPNATVPNATVPDPTSGSAAAAGAPSEPSSRAFPGPAMAPASTGGPALPSAEGGLPRGERPQMTNATRFHLEYDIDAVGPSGVAEVQLWATADGGHSWRLWGCDEDLESPFDVVVEEEGIFGFHVVIVGRNGLSGRRPRTGDLADIWVGIDTTLPIARLTSATYGEGADAGRLLIRWNASDAHLDPRPITLKFGESLKGPWTVIASALPNTGEYAWPADPQLPPSVFLRLEVRDEAGNVSVDQLTEPIRIDGLAPKARIRGVLPAPELDREAFRQPRRS